MMPGQVNPPGHVWVCPRCKTVVEYCCSCPGTWGAPVIPDDVEPLCFNHLDDAIEAAAILKSTGEPR